MAYLVYVYEADIAGYVPVVLLALLMFWTIRQYGPFTNGPDHSATRPY